MRKHSLHCSARTEGVTEAQTVSGSGFDPMRDGIPNTEFIGWIAGRTPPFRSEKLLCVFLQGTIFGLWRCVDNRIAIHMACWLTPSSKH